MHGCHIKKQFICWTKYTLNYIKNYQPNSIIYMRAVYRVEVFNKKLYRESEEELYNFFRKDEENKKSWLSKITLNDPHTHTESDILERMCTR